MRLVFFFFLDSFSPPGGWCLSLSFPMDAKQKPSRALPGARETLLAKRYATTLLRMRRERREEKPSAIKAPSCTNVTMKERKGFALFFSLSCVLSRELL